MIKWFLHRKIAPFERTWNYDASYVHELIDADLRAAFTLALQTETVEEFEAHRRSLTGLAYRMLGSRAEAKDVTATCARYFDGVDARAQTAVAARASQFSAARCVRSRFRRSKPRDRPRRSRLPAARGACALPHRSWSAALSASREERVAWHPPSMPASLSGDAAALTKILAEDVTL